MDQKTEKDFFPHETIREGQEDMLKDFAKALENKQFLLAHAPTGIGKTATALSMAVKHALENDKVVFFSDEQTYSTSDCYPYASADQEKD